MPHAASSSQRTRPTSASASEHCDRRLGGRSRSGRLWHAVGHPSCLWPSHGSRWMPARAPEPLHASGPAPPARQQCEGLAQLPFRRCSAHGQGSQSWSASTAAPPAWQHVCGSTGLSMRVMGAAMRRSGSARAGPKDRAAANGTDAVNTLRETVRGTTAGNTRGLRFMQPSGHVGACTARRPAFSHGAPPPGQRRLEP
eukprot:4799723-Prymnesium_polylepis.2